MSARGLYHEGHEGLHTRTEGTKPVLPSAAFELGLLRMGIDDRWAAGRR